MLVFTQNVQTSHQGDLEKNQAFSKIKKNQLSYMTNVSKDQKE